MGSQERQAERQAEGQAVGQAERQAEGQAERHASTRSAAHTDENACLKCTFHISIVLKNDFLPLSLSSPSSFSLSLSLSRPSHRGSLHIFDSSHFIFIIISATFLLSSRLNMISTRLGSSDLAKVIAHLLLN